MTKEITIHQLKYQPPYKKVTVKAKIIEIGETAKLDDGCQVQHILIADNTGTAELALWQNLVDTVTSSESYKLGLKHLKKPRLYAHQDTMQPLMKLRIYQVLHLQVIH